MRFKKLILAIGLVLSMAIPASTEVWPTPCTPSNPINCSRGTWGQEARDFMDNTFDLLTAKIVSFFSDVDTIHKYATFEAAVTALCPTGDSSPEKTLIIPVVTTVAANTTVCNKLTLEFTGKGSLEPAVSITVTVNGPVISAKPLADITGGAGTVTFGSQLLNMPNASSTGSIARAQIPSELAYEDEANTFSLNQRINAGLGINAAPPATGKINLNGQTISGMVGVDNVLNYADFATAITSIGATVKTLIIPTVTASIVSNETIPSTLTLQFTGSGQLNVGSVTLATLTSAEYGTLEFTTTTMIRTSGSWITDNYNVADATITITGSASNNVTCGVASATALILTVDSSCTLVNEAASAAETVNGQDPWTVTINGPGGNSWPTRQIFSGDGDVVITDSSIISWVPPEWWGAKSDGSTDGFDAIISAIKTKKPIRWGKGTYIYASAINYNTLVDDGFQVDDVNWEGDGVFTTIIKYTGSGTGITMGRFSPFYGPGIVMKNLSLFGDGVAGHTSTTIGGYTTTTSANAGSTSTQTGISVSSLGPTSSTWINVRFKFWDIAFVSVLSYHLEFPGTIFQGNNVGIKFAATTTASSLKRTEFAGNAVGVWFSGVGIQNIQLTDSVFEANTAGTAILSNGIGDLVIARNYFTNNVDNFVHIGWNGTIYDLLNRADIFQNTGISASFGDSVRIVKMYDNNSDDTVNLSGGNYSIKNEYSFQNVGLHGQRRIFVKNNISGFTGTTHLPYTNYDGTNADEFIHDDVKAAKAGITASTTQTQGQVPLSFSISEISTVANANDTVTLPTAVEGVEIFIINNGANTLKIFPASGDNLGSGVNTSTTLASGGRVTYVAYDATNWVVK